MIITETIVTLALSKILTRLDIIGPALVVFAYVASSRKKTPVLNMVLVFCLVHFICNAYATYIDIIDGQNYWVYKLNTIATLLIVMMLFSHYLLSFDKQKKWLLAISFLLIILLPAFSGEGITSYNSYSSALSSIMVVALCLYYFYIKLLQSSPEESVPSTAIFWCVIGLFVYYAGSFFVFISYKYLIETDSGSVAALWKFHNLLLFIACISISYGIVCRDYQTISS